MNCVQSYRFLRFKFRERKFVDSILFKQKALHLIKSTFSVKETTEKIKTKKKERKWKNGKTKKKNFNHTNTKENGTLCRMENTMWARGNYPGHCGSETLLSIPTQGHSHVIT